MLLRSSSTPILGSLIPAISHSDSHPEKEGKTNSSLENTKHFCFHKANAHAYPFSSFDSCSAVEESDGDPASNFRRAQSESDLESLVRGSAASAKDATEKLWHGIENPYEDFLLGSVKKPWTRRIIAHRRPPSLQSIPSFSCYNVDESEDISLGENNIVMNGGMMEAHQEKFSFRNEAIIENFGGIKDLAGPQDKQETEPASAPLFLARGLGVGLVDPLAEMGGGNGKSFRKGVSTGGGGSGDGFGAGSDNIEENYERMLEENPTNALILRNYAQFLYESKHDYHKAEEYYSRAILAQPDDGEVLASYAKLLWELHGDEERATMYFEQAVQAAPADCNVHAAYASFLWDTDKDEQEEEHLGFCNGSNASGAVNSAIATVP